MVVMGKGRRARRGVLVRRWAMEPRRDFFRRMRFHLLFRRIPGISVRAKEAAGREPAIRYLVHS
jgi:hypothetical protein